MKWSDLKTETVPVAPVAPVGGQQCGVMPVGVKVTHLPTGIAASCHHERSQMKNRNIALSMIEWALAEIEWVD